MSGKQKTLAAVIGVALSMTVVSMEAQASSHREAPLITEMPKVDGTDFYMFRSYEPGRESYITFIANYYPLQDAYGGPNYFNMDPDALYEIHIDKNGDALEDITFQFQFSIEQPGLQLPVGLEGAKVNVDIPLINSGRFDTANKANLHRRETYSMNVVYGDRRSGNSQGITHLIEGTTVFEKPIDNIGNKSINDYVAYADAHIYPIAIPGCHTAARVFVGQRQEGFAVNLGEIFDLVNTNPLGPIDGETNVLGDKNVTSLALEVPVECVTNGSEKVIGAWTTASVPQARIINSKLTPSSTKGATVEGGAWAQVSRLGQPLVNEVVIGIKDKDRFNTSEPVSDADSDIGFGKYVFYPTLPELLEILFAGTAVAPELFPRNDLVEVFLTGIQGVNQPAGVVASEMLRLNTDTLTTARSSQNNLGVLGGDLAGFPNGRRPGDDVVDAALRVMMGAAMPATLSTQELGLQEDADAAEVNAAISVIAPNFTAPLTDGVTLEANDFLNRFPYLNTPLAGSVIAAE